MSGRRDSVLAVSKSRRLSAVVAPKLGSVSSGGESMERSVSMSACLAVAVVLELWMWPGGWWRKELRVVELIAM